MRIFSMLLLASFAILTACTKEDAGPGTISTTAPMEAIYSTTDGIIPFPNNILFAGSTDGTVNITVVDAADISDPKVGINALDGFSTIAPITTTFALPIDATTVAAAVRVFEVTDAGIFNSFAVTGITAELLNGTDFVALPSPTNDKLLVIKPIKPLKSNTNYMVIVSNSLKSTSGESARPSALYTILKSPTALVDPYGASQVPGRDDATAGQLEGLRQLNQAMLGVASALATPTIAAADVVVAWSFKTQTVGAVLAAVQATSAANVTGADFITFPVTPSGATGNLGVLPASTFATVNNVPTAAVANVASVVIGAVKLPYFLDAYSSANPTAPLTGKFEILNPATALPTLKSTQTVPFLMTIPASPAPAGGWPVVIFQHGFTVDKSVVFGVANTLATAGFATIAIDAVLHGSRTFGLDYYNNTTGALGPDGVADTSGKHYLNLASLLTARDNVRQSVLDLVHLTRLLEIQTMDVVNNTTGAPGADAVADIPQAGFKFVGHSNGGILGTMFMAVEPAIVRGVLANPGGVYTDILQNSVSISPDVNAGLLAKGVATGSADYGSFMVAAQTVVDDADPINYAATAGTRSIFLMKTTPDAVVPNTQTDILSANMGLAQVSGNGATGWPSVLASPQSVNSFINYTAGTHSSFLSPTDSAAATTAMQTDMATFLAAGLIATSSTTVTE